MLKAGGEDTADALTKIFKDIQETEVILDIWKTALIVRLPKKGDLGRETTGAESPYYPLRV